MKNVLLLFPFYSHKNWGKTNTEHVEKNHPQFHLQMLTNITLHDFPVILEKQLWI